MTEQDISTIFAHMDFDTKQLHQLWEDIQQINREHPSLWNYKIVEELDLNEYDWGRGYLLKRILPAMRNTLESHEIISVKEESPQGSENDRRVWVIV